MSELIDIEDIFKQQNGDDLNVRKQKEGCNIKLKHDFNKLNKKNMIEKEDYDKEFIENVPGQGRIFVKTFGCSHNISDSEFMMGQLSEFGYILEEKVENAELVLINSCTVKNPSQDAFINWVKSSKERGQKIVVAGCVPQGEKDIEDLDKISVVGVTNIDRVVEVVNETMKGNVVKFQSLNNLPSLDLPKIRKNHLIEIIPINTGCLGACTYCKTVQARGKLGSYHVEDILKRVKDVVQEGVKEIWLTSEDTGAWGRDIQSNISILLKSIVQSLPSNVMLRVGMTNPPYILAHLQSIASILNHPQVYSFLHIPVQAGNNSVLNQMNREYTVEEFRQCCDYLIENVPDITIATDIICGFPGETDEQFEDTLKLCEDYKFRILNISQFYPRPGTPAFKMKRVNTKTVKSRSRAITALFESYQNWSMMMDRELLVLASDVEDRKGVKNVVAHSKNYAKCLLPYDLNLLGKFIKVKVVAVHKWHLDVEILELDCQQPAFDNIQHFLNYNTQGETKRELKYQQVIQARLLRNNNTQNTEEQIYTKFDLIDINTNQQEESLSQSFSTISQQSIIYTKQKNYENQIFLLGIILIITGLLLSQK